MVERARFAIGIAMIWLAAVAGVSATAWLAIDQAGREVSDVGAISQLPRPVGTPAANPTADGDPSGADALPAGSATARPTAKTGPSAPSKTRTHLATTRPSIPAPRIPSPSRTRQARPQPPTSPHDRTFDVAGGQVSVRCSGATMTLRIAQPDNGWRVEVVKVGTDKVEVRFQRVDDNAGPGTRVMTVCADGSPALTVDQQG